MAELLLSVSQYYLLPLHSTRGFPIRTTSLIQRLPSRKTIEYRTPFDRLRGIICFPLRAVSAADSTKASSALITNSVDSKGIAFEPEIGSGGGDGDNLGGSGGSGGSGGGGGDDSGKEGGGESSDDSKRKMALSMSQKFTIGYAALVGVGGLMGYLKSGSQKSLLAGGASAAVLYYVYRELPTNPVFASSVGVVMSAALTGMMGSRFLRTRKVFPAGVVSFVSLVMTGGYLHGIMRSAH